LQDPAATIRAPVEAKELTFEFMLNALRLSAGVSFERFSDRTGLDLQSLEPTWSHLVSQGLVQRQRIATTPLGFRYLDSVVQQFLV
jgi:oxygen-independent coproporphyrinogen-3 oxidase